MLVNRFEEFPNMEFMLNSRMGEINIDKKGKIKSLVG
jgi:hypothetical protein